MPLKIGVLLNDRYRIEAVLGQGGFGAVYLATDERLELPCAVKENLNISPESERQFRREATLLATLRHPNLPRVTHHFVLGGHQYLVMDFVEGEDLDHRLEREGVLSEEDVLRWTEQICDALIYLHDRDPPVIHRDIKPANIRITPDGDAILVDFGIAKAAAAEQTTSRGARGVTPGFAPPEQYGLGRTDPRADVYALGATLYCLLTGEPPPDSVELLVGREVLKPPNQLRDDLSTNVVDALVKAMECRRENRFHTIDEFLAALKDKTFTVYPLEEEEITPEPEVIPEEAQVMAVKPARKYWRFAFLGILVFISALTIVFVNSPNIVDMVGSIQDLIANPPRGLALKVMPLSTIIGEIITSIEDTPTVPGSTPTPTQTPTLHSTPTRTPAPELITVDNAHHWRLYSTWSEGYRNVPLAMSPDGKTVALYVDKGVSIYDVLTGETVGSIQNITIKGDIIGLALFEDFLLIKFEDELLSWDLTLHTWAEKQYDIKGRDIVISQDGRYIATRDKYVNVFSLETGQLLLTVGREDSQQAIALSPDGGYFAIAVEKDVELWDLAKARKIWRIAGHGELTEELGLEFTADSKFLVSASGDIWTVPGGKLVGYFDSSTETITISPTNDLIVGNDGSVWNFATGEMIGLMPVRSTGVNTMQFTPDGKFLVMHRTSGNVDVWTIDPDAVAFREDTIPETATLSEYEQISSMNVSRLANLWQFTQSGYEAIIFSPDGRTFAGWSRREVDVVSITDPKLITQFRVDYEIIDVAYLGNDFILILSGSPYYYGRGSVGRWEISTGRLKQTYEIEGQAIAASPDGTLFAVQREYIQVIDVISGDIVHRLGSKYGGEDFIFTPDGKYLAITTGASVRFWSTENGMPGRQYVGHGPKTRDIAFTPAGDRLISASGDVWDVGNGELLSFFDSNSEMLALSPDGDLIVGSDGALYEGTSGQYIGQLEDTAAYLVFTANGKQLIWLRSTGTVCVYGIEEITRHVLPYVEEVESPTLKAMTSMTAQEINLLGWWGSDALLAVRYIADNLQPQATIYGEKDYAMYSLAPDGKSLVALYDKGIEILSSETGQVIDQYRIFLNPSTIREIGYLGDDLLILKEEAGLERWDLEEQTLVQRYNLTGHDLVVSPDGSFLALRSGNLVKVVNVETGKVLSFSVADVPQAYQFSPGGEIFAVSTGAAVDLRDPSNGRRQRILYGHTPVVSGLAFTPDGTRLIAATGDIWEVASGDRVVRFEGTANTMAISTDGTMFVGDDGAVRETETGQRIFTLTDLRASASNMCFTSNGEHLLWRTEQGTIYNWGVRVSPIAAKPTSHEEVLTAEESRELMILSHIGRGRLINALWSPDDQYLAVNTTQNALVYKSTTLDQVGRFLDAKAVAFDSEGDVLIGGNQPLRSIDIQTGEILWTYGQRYITAGNYSPDGRWLAISGQVSPQGEVDGLALIDLTDNLVYVLDDGRGLYEEATDLEFTPDSKYLIQSFHGSIYLWDIEMGSQIRNPITGNLSPATISPDGKYIAYITRYSIQIENLLAGGQYRQINADGTPFFPTGIEHPSLQPYDLVFQKIGRLLIFYRSFDRQTFMANTSTISWNIDTGTAQVIVRDFLNLSQLDSLYSETYDNEWPRRVPAFGLSPGEDLMYSLTGDGVVRVMDVSGEILASSSSDYLDVMAISPDREQVALPNSIGGIDVVDVASSEVVRSISGSWSPVWMSYNSPSVLMILQSDRTLSFLNIATGRVIDGMMDDRYEDAEFSALSSDGKLFAVMSLKGGLKQVNVFSLSPDGPLFDLGRFPLPFEPVFSPDDQILAVVRRNKVELWSMQTKELVADPLEGIGATIGPLAFTPDGSHLIAATGEIWSLIDGSMLATFMTSDPKMEIRTNGQIIVGQDGTIWDVANGEYVGILEGLHGPAINFEFTLDGRRLIWQRVGGVIEVWGINP